MANKTDIIVGDFSKVEIETLKSTIAKGTDEHQFRLFINTCVNSGLNPFLNHIYCIVYAPKDKPPTMNIQISAEGILYLARKKEDFRGIDSQLVYENDDFKFNAATQEIVHSIAFPRGQLIGGYAIAKRADFNDIVVLMEVAEVEHLKKGPFGKDTLWAKYFEDMFKKHLIKRAAKLQFGIEIGEDAETTSVSTVSTPGNRIDITPNEASKTIATNEEIQGDPTQELIDVIDKKREEKGITTSELVSFVEEKFKTDVASLNTQQLCALSKLVDGGALDKKEEPQEEMSFDDIDFG